MRIALQPAFVLHTRPFRETSVLVELLSQDHGRITCVAKGVRQAKSRLKPLLQSFVPLIVSWQGKTDLMSLNTVEPASAPLQLKGNNLLSGLYLNELLVRLLQKHDPHSALYSLYYDTLTKLQTNTLLQSHLRLFEKKLLEELGYGLQLDHEIDSTNPLRADYSYFYYPERGFELITDAQHKQSSHVFLGKSLLDLQAEQLEDEVSLRDAKRLMRLTLAVLLEGQLLHSRKLFIA